MTLNRSTAPALGARVHRSPLDGEALAVVAAVRAGHPTLRVDARLSALRLERLSA